MSEHHKRVLIFGHGHRIEDRDLSDPVAEAALLEELLNVDQIRSGVGSPELANAINALLQKVNTIMTDLSGLRDAVTRVQSTDSAAVAELQSLADRVSQLSAGDVSQAEIDGITADLTAASNKIADAASQATVTTAAPVPGGAVAPTGDTGAGAPGTPVDTAPTSNIPTTDQIPAGQPTDQAVPAGPVVTDSPIATTPAVEQPPAPADTPAAPADAPADAPTAAPADSGAPGDAPAS